MARATSTARLAQLEGLHVTTDSAPVEGGRDECLGELTTRRGAREGDGAVERLTPTQESRYLDPVGADGGVDAAGGKGVTLGLEEVDGLAQQRVHPVAHSLVGQHTCGQAREVGPREPGSGGRIGHPVPEVQGSLEVVGGRRRTVLLAGDARPDRGLEGERPVLGSGCVEGEGGAVLPTTLGRAELDPPAQGARVGGVHRDQLPREQVVVHRFPKQGVAEGEPVATTDHDVAVEHLVQRARERLVVEKRRVLQDLEVEAAAAH